MELYLLLQQRSRLDLETKQREGGEKICSGDNDTLVAKWAHDSKIIFIGGFSLHKYDLDPDHGFIQKLDEYFAGNIESYLLTLMQTRCFHLAKAMGFGQQLYLIEIRKFSINTDMENEDEGYDDKNTKANAEAQNRLNETEIQQSDLDHKQYSIYDGENMMFEFYFEKLPKIESLEYFEEELQICSFNFIIDAKANLGCLGAETNMLSTIYNISGPFLIDFLNSRFKAPATQFEKMVWNDNDMKFVTDAFFSDNLFQKENLAQTDC